MKANKNVKSLNEVVLNNTNTFIWLCNSIRMINDTQNIKELYANIENNIVVQNLIIGLSDNIDSIKSNISLDNKSIMSNIINDASDKLGWGIDFSKRQDVSERPMYFWALPVVYPFIKISDTDTLYSVFSNYISDMAITYCDEHPNLDDNLDDNIADKVNNVDSYLIDENIDGFPISNKQYVSDKDIEDSNCGNEEDQINFDEHGIVVDLHEYNEYFNENRQCDESDSNIMNENECDDEDEDAVEDGYDTEGLLKYFEMFATVTGNMTKEEDISEIAADICINLSKVIASGNMLVIANPYDDSTLNIASNNITIVDVISKHIVPANLLSAGYDMVKTKENLVKYFNQFEGRELEPLHAIKEAIENNCI